MKENPQYDVVIIGGSYAGLAAAMALGRSLRSVLVIDSGKPCNRQTPHAHNFITWDGAAPSEITARAKEQVLRYPGITVMQGKATDVCKREQGFITETENGKHFRSKKIVLATGISDTMPDVEGFSDCWGISALHCPYCHGYEAKGKKTAVFANGEEAYHVCLVLINWTKEIVLLTNGPSTLTQEQTEKLKKHRIEIIEKELKRMEHKKGYVEVIHFKDETTLSVPVLYAKLPFSQHSPLAERLGCEMTDEGLIKTDECRRTTVHGVYAAGDNASNARNIAMTVGAGTTAGIMINGELSAESF